MRLSRNADESHSWGDCVSFSMQVRVIPRSSPSARPKTFTMSMIETDNHSQLYLLLRPRLKKKGKKNNFILPLVAGKKFTPRPFKCIS